MKWKKFENKIKKDVGEHQSSVNVQDIWANIDSEVSELNKKRKRRRYFFWLWSTMSMLILAVLVTYMLVPSENTQEASSKNQLISKDHTSKKNIDKKEKQEAAFLAQDSEIKKENLEESKVKLDEPNTLENTASPNTIDNDNRRKTVSPEARPNLVHKQFDSNTKNDQESNIDSLSQINLKSSIPTNKQDMITKAKSLDSIKTQNPEFTITKNNQNPKTSKNQSNPTISNINYLSPQRISEKNTLISGMIMLDSLELPQLNDSQKTLSWSLLAYGGISQIHKSLETNQTIISESRKGTEKLLEASHFGLKIFAEHRSGFVFGAGIQRTAINERFDYQNIETKITEVEGVQFLRVKLAGDLQELSGPVVSNTTTRINKRIYNEYEFYEIPLSLGYHKRLGLWQLGLQVGLTTNLRLRTKGQIIDNSGRIVNIGANQSSFFKNRIRFSYDFALPIRRYFGKNLNLNLEPTLSIYPDITTSNYLATQKYNLLGIRLGMMYRIR